MFYKEHWYLYNHSNGCYEHCKENTVEHYIQDLLIKRSQRGFVVKEEASATGSWLRRVRNRADNVEELYPGIRFEDPLRPLESDILYNTLHHVIRYS
jgi:hypothetical protein